MQAAANLRTTIDKGLDEKSGLGQLHKVSNNKYIVFLGSTPAYAAVRLSLNKTDKGSRYGTFLLKNASLMDDTSLSARHAKFYGP